MFFYDVRINVNTEFPKNNHVRTYTLKKRSVTMRSLKNPTQRIFSNLINQNQKLILLWTSQQQCPVSSVSRFQRPESSVQSPGIQNPASRVQRIQHLRQDLKNFGVLKKCSNILRFK